MPREQNILLKYKCSEFCCCKVIRKDKWLQHCKKFHAFKTKRGDEIKRKRKFQLNCARHCRINPVNEIILSPIDRDYSFLIKSARISNL